MKKTFLLFFIVLSYATFAQQQKITKEQAIELAEKLTQKQDVNVYISKQIITPKAQIPTMYETYIAPDYESYLPSRKSKDLREGKK